MRGCCWGWVALVRGVGRGGVMIRVLGVGFVVE